MKNRFKSLYFLYFIALSMSTLLGAKFCDVKINKDQPKLLTIDDPKVKDQDTEKLRLTIKKFAPIAYLHKEEEYLPIRAEEYFTGNQTSMKSRPTDTLVKFKDKFLSKGELTMKKIFELAKAEPEGNNYFDIAKCIESGSDPAKNKNKSGSLNTPVYVLTFKQNGKLYIQYLFFYGFNGPYTMGLESIEKIEKLPGGKKLGYNLREAFNAHEADLEHITLEFDPTDLNNPKRIYYGSHGRREGMWLNWDNKDIEKIDDHPVIYIAKGGHGHYPKAGNYLRIFGFANDETEKGVKWEPELIRIYKDNDKRFDPATMGWLYHVGSLGKHGVGAPGRQLWFGDVSQDIGRPYDSVLFCPAPVSKLCVLAKRFKAKIPD